MINHEHEFIFVRVAKTGSTSILETLPEGTNQREHCSEVNWEYDCNHIPLWHLKNNLDKDSYDNYFKFAFVRNPFQRAVSTIKYWNNWSTGKQRGVWRRGPTFSLKDFFTDKIPKRYINPDKFFSKYGSQYDFTKGCDFIGRFENIQEDFNTICDKIGIPRQVLPHENKSKHKKHYTEYYDDETKQIITEKYAKDIEYFGYEFGE